MPGHRVAAAGRRVNQGDPDVVAGLRQVGGGLLVRAAHRRDLQQVLTGAIYTDNLCVVAAPGGHSIAAENRLRATTGEAVGALMNDPASGIYGVASEDGKLRVNMLQLTQPLYDKFAALGLNHLILDPWIRPAAGRRKYATS